MTPSEGIEAATRVLGCYPKRLTDGTGDGYLGALAAVLCSYPKQVAQRCSDPILGITRECKFLPTVADIVAWCERNTAPLWNSADREARIERQLADRAQPQVSSAQRERIAAGLNELAESMRAGMQPTPEQLEARAQKDAESRQHRIAQIRAEWNGSPPTIAGIPVSRELADKLIDAANAAAE